MKELDFDELDKAVNSLMQTVPNTASATNVASPKADPVAVDIPAPLAATPSTPVAAATPAVASAAPTAPPEEAPKKPSGSLAEKRSGRFMDVMHPSSDMRPGSSKTLPASRQGVSLAPISSTVVPEMPSKPPVKEEGQAATVDAPAPAAAEPKSMTPAPADTPWPDPIDMHTSLQEETSPEELIQQESDMPSSSDVNAKNDATEETLVSTPSASEPEPTSPFLADAKVEKRPLGGSSSSSSPLVEQQSPSTLPGEATDKISAPDSEAVTNEAPAEEDEVAQVLLPAELGEEITAIEADNSNHSSHHEASETSVAAQAGNNGAAGFISKQYKEKESSGDKEHVAIYDNNTQPLAHPAKKKSGWSVVIWILVIILLCVAVAAGLYFSGIIQLPA